MAPLERGIRIGEELTGSIPGAAKQGETKGITGGVVWMAVDERGAHKFTAVRSSWLGTESVLPRRIILMNAYANCHVSPTTLFPPPPPQRDLWNGKFSVRFHGKSFPGHRPLLVKTRSLSEKYPRYYGVHPSERIVSQFKPVSANNRCLRRFGRTLCQMKFHRLRNIGSAFHG